MTPKELQPLLESDSAFNQRFLQWLTQYPSLEAITKTLHERTLLALLRDGNGVPPLSPSLRAITRISPPSPPSPQPRFLYVRQGEWAKVTPTQQHGIVQYIGTDDATTCHIIAIRKPVTGDVVVAHVDTIEALAHMTELEVAVLSGGVGGEQEDRGMMLELFLVGGYVDPRPMVQSMSKSLFAHFSLVASKHYKLMVAAIGPANTILLPPGSGGRAAVPSPRCRSLGFRCSDGAFFSGDFPPQLRRPAKVLRSARGMSGNSKETLAKLDYDASAGTLTIHPFYWSKNNRSFSWLLNLDDDELLHYTSTSPLVEGPHFVPEMRKVFSLLLTDDGTNTFRHGQPLCYTLPIVSIEELLQEDVGGDKHQATKGNPSQSTSHAPTKCP